MTNDQTDVTNHTRKRWLIRAALFFFIVGLVYAIYWLFIGEFREKTDDAYVTGNLIQVMPQVSGYVTAIRADETDLVKKGQPLVILDKADAYLALKNAEAQFALTIRQVNQLYKNVDELQSHVQIAQDNLKKAEEDYQRRHHLIVNKTISLEDMRHANIAFDSAKDALSAAENKLSSARALIENSDLYHHPQVLQAATMLRNAYLNWQRTTIYAPETGYIAKRPVEVGQRVTPNTVLMIIVSLNQMWVDANFKESQLKHIRIGQPVELISDTYGDSVKYKGTVVGLNPGAGNVFDLFPPQNATGNWIKIVQRLPVRIAINRKQLAEHPLRMGLSMSVIINTRNRKGDVVAKLPQQNVIYQTKDYTTDLKEADELIEAILSNNAKNTSYHLPQ